MSNIPGDRGGNSLGGWGSCYFTVATIANRNGGYKHISRTLAITIRVTDKKTNSPEASKKTCAVGTPVLQAKASCTEE